MKKKLPIIILIILLLGGGAFFFITRDKKTEEESTVTKKKISQPVNVIDVADRPYMILTPSADGHYITIGVEELKMEADELNYEMEYQTGSMLQGFQGLISLNTLPTSEKKLFGSQSAGGAITYHEDIKGGNLLAEYDGKEDYAVKSAWRYFTNSEDETSFSSQDTKFTITNASLANYSYVVIYNSPGYPGELKSELLSDPYVVRAEKSLKSISSNFEVMIKSSDENAIIMGYDGEEWQKMETEIADGMATASGPFMDAYILVKS
jgi:hypothetical protein